MNRKLPRFYCGLTVALSLFTIPGSVAFAQAGSPLPGGSPANASSAPVPGANPAASQVPIRQTGSGRSAYQQLPLSNIDAQARIDELKSLIPEARPQELQESVVQLGEWLADLADAHNKLSLTFAKSDATKSQAEAERLAAHRFSQLKNQALLIKAELLIKQQRYPEALGPLVDIVVQEPRSSTGQAAYKRLKEIGFTQEAEPPHEVKTQTGAPQSAATQPAAGAPAVAPAVSKPAIAAKPESLPLPKRQHSSPPKAVAHKGPTVWLNGSPFGAGRAAASHKPAASHRLLD